MTRDDILDHGLTLVREGGARALTLDRLAERSGLSKGGVLYHFRTKAVLHEALIAHVFDAFEAEVEREMEGGKTLAEASIDCALTLSDGKENVVAAMLIASEGAEPLVQSLKKRYARWIDELEESGLSRANARVLSFALDGIFLMTALGVAPVEPHEEAVVGTALRRLATPSPTEGLAAAFRGALDEKEQGALPSTT